jgi:hypothetical protein
MPRFSAADSTDWLTTHDPLAVAAWRDPVVEQIGHAPRSIYVETYWLPILGPSATWAMRRLTAWLDAEPFGYELSLAEFGRELGLGAGTGRNAIVIRTLSRLVAFGMATPFGDALAVRQMLAPLTRRQIQSLPAVLAARHDVESPGVVQPLTQRTAQPASTALYDTTSQLRVAPVVEEGCAGKSGTGAADRSGKPTAIPRPPFPNPRPGGPR